MLKVQPPRELKAIALGSSESVQVGEPAATAGLRQGDVITKVNGQAATSNIQLQELSLTKKAGDKVQIGYTRDGKESTATVTLGTQQ